MTFANGLKPVVSWDGSVPRTSLNMKPTPKLLILSIITLLIIPVTIATTWTQYTPSPTTEDLTQVFSLPNGYAYALTSTASHCFLYDTNTWEEIQCPDDAMDLTGYTFISADYISTSEVLLAYQNTTNTDIHIIRYNTYNNTYLDYLYIVEPTFNITTTFACVNEQDTCYIAPIYNTGVYKVYPTPAFIANSTGYTLYMLHSNYKIVLTGYSYTGMNIAEWNGVNFINRSAYIPALKKHLYDTAQNRATQRYTGGYIGWYNYTTGQFYLSGLLVTGGGGTISDITNINGEIHFTYLQQIRKTAWNSNTYSTSLINTSATLESIDYSSSSGKGWAVGDTGIIYEYGGMPTGNMSYPIINAISVSPSTDICINQWVEININATSTNTSDDLVYDWDCDGNRTSMYNHYRFNNFLCYYSTIGIRNVPVFVSYEVNNAYISEDTVTLNVTNCTANATILLKVLNWNNGLELAGVDVSLSDAQTSTTDGFGNVGFNVNASQNYTYTMSKNGYYTASYTTPPSPVRIITYLKPTTSITGEQLTTLTIITQNASLNRISGSLIAATNPLTGESKNGITDANGTITLTDMFYADKILITAVNKEKGYEYQSLTTNLANHETKTITITLKTITGEGIFKVTDRGCKDIISGVWLCGYLNTTATGNKCAIDADCISGSCSFGIPKECAKFNYTLCDRGGMKRGSYCMILYSLMGSGKGFASTILKYFLYFILLIGIIFVIVLLRRERK